ncbi:MAG: hypothetical protein JW915_01945 [Chitinispirillaceae bacterium]|nr:hypothetical protein [Chitinispirillaceae bacterium]
MTKELFQLDSNANIEDVKGLLKKINETGITHKTDIFKEYILRNKPHHDWAVRFLPLGDDSELGVWLEQNFNRIKDDYTWIEIAKSANHFQRNEANNKVFKVLLKRLNTLTDKDARHEILFTFRLKSMYEESEYFSKLLKVETDEPCRIDLYVILCRFKNAEIDSMLKNRLQQWEEPAVLYGFIDKGIKRNNRHDYIETLIELKSTLLTIKNPAKLADAKETIELLSTIIHYLEQKKAENAPIGLPLNWPEGNAQK